MKKYMKYIAPALLILGAALLVFGVVCACCAGSGLGKLEDTYYYLGMNLHHGRFDACDAGEVIEMLDDMGISDTVLNGFEAFSMGARYVFIVLGVLFCAAGGVLMYKKSFAVPEKAADAAAFICEKAVCCAKKVCVWACAAYEWVRGVLKIHRCPVCGERLTKGALFCGGCGAKLAEAGRCPGCGAHVEADARFCNSCGRQLDR